MWWIVCNAAGWRGGGYLVSVALDLTCQRRSVCSAEWSAGSAQERARPATLLSYRYPSLASVEAERWSWSLEARPDDDGSTVPLLYVCMYWKPGASHRHGLYHIVWCCHWYIQASRHARLHQSLVPARLVAGALKPPSHAAPRVLTDTPSPKPSSEPCASASAPAELARRGNTLSVRGRHGPIGERPSCCLGCDRIHATSTLSPSHHTMTAIRL